jgi:hypothetical protein
MALRRKSSLKRVAVSEDQRSESDRQSSAPQKSARGLTLTPKLSAKTQHSAPTVTPEIIDPVLAGFLELNSDPIAPTSVHENTRAPVQENTPEGTTARVESAIDKLGDLEAAVIAALFPTDGSAPASFEKIAQKLGLTLQEVQSLADNGLRGLRGTKARTPRISTVWN